jgi:hypothetical protein
MFPLDRIYQNNCPSLKLLKRTMLAIMNRIMTFVHNLEKTMEKRIPIMNRMITNFTISLLGFYSTLNSIPTDVCKGEEKMKELTFRQYCMGSYSTVED